MKVKVAEESERFFCLQFVEEVYTREGYFFNKKEMEIFLDHLAVFFISSGRGEISSTISVVLDSDRGLPLDSIFAEEANFLRKNGKIAEIGKFATHGGSTSGLLSQAFMLMVRALDFATRNCVTDLCITVNPKHVSFYKFLGFTVMGLEKEHSVGAPAIFMTATVRGLHRKRRGTRK